LFVLGGDVSRKDWINLENWSNLTNNNDKGLGEKRPLTLCKERKEKREEKFLSSLFSLL
jgi:hypothetical protein